MTFIKKEATVEDIQDLINWLETRTGYYNAQDPWGCAIAQYLRDRGHKYVHFDGTHELHADTDHIVLPKVIGDIVYGQNAILGGRNMQRFTDALARARVEHAGMLYAIKPTEDPGAGIMLGTSLLRSKPEDPDAAHVDDIDDSDDENGNFA